MLNIAVVRGLPRFTESPFRETLHDDHIRMNNAFLIQGASPEFVLGDNGNQDRADVVVWVEQITAPGAYSVLDRDNNVIIASAAHGLLDWTHSPKRFDGGIKIVGSDVVCTGFYKSI